MKRAGHASPNMAMRYQHATEERDRDISEKLGALMEAAESSLEEPPAIQRRFNAWSE